MNWGTNTNLVAVIDIIFILARKWHMSQDEVVKQVFVFSDIQFNAGMNQAI